MKKNDLKQLIKPLVKECIHEVLLEEGLLSTVVAEVTKGLSGDLIVERQQKPDPQLFNEDMQVQRKSQETRVKLQEHRQKLMDSIGGSSYNGVDLFEGTQPMKNRESQSGAPDLGDPRDAGVDISSILGNASHIWQSIK
ncbi:hypothetical protein CMI47_22560 [Candidatus Pacearchaeota archaeon]|nr:hypothetical protein [Candidatus Pacearchaeota archaeon]|tara:strand:+ start:50 stop:466 length:417 start_codon:yes stop_codon:yes gene_type:complete